MGCSNSKDDTADLAGNFFGDEPSVKKPGLAPTEIPPSAFQPVPVKSALSKKNHPATVMVTTPIKQQPTTSSATTVSRSPDDSGGNKKNGRPSSSRREGSPKVSSPALERSNPEVKASPQTTSLSSSDRTNGTAKKTNYNNKSGSPRKPKRKNDFVAPPSSESFVTNPAEPNRPASNKVQAATKKSEFTLPPPPPNELASNPVTLKNSPRHEEDSKETGNDDDDDFSVAPSLATTYRSVVKTSFDQIYERGKKLGYGAFAQVFIGIHRPTKQNYAIKQVDRSKMFWGDRDALKDEIENLKKVREGPNIVQLYEVFEEKHYCYLVTELMSGGELFDRIIEKKTFSEKEARACCRCVLSALEYMHSKRVAHRDLKPENLLLADPKLLLPVKLADFGFAKSVGKKNGCRTLCGTPGYLAPEILERWPAYDVKCDVWSVGVILFLLLGGYLPFDDDDEDKVFDRTRNGQYDFRPQFWRNISSGAKDLVTRCLTINPNKRVDTTQALNHEWMAVKEAELETHSVDVSKLKKSFQAKKNMKVTDNAAAAENRLKQLNDDFSTYLEKRRGDSMVSHFSYMTGGTTRSTHVKYIPDSSTGKPFATFFKVGELLAEGNSSSIYSCLRKSTSEYYAVKHIKKEDLDKARTKTLKDEISALKLLRGGPHIVRLYDVFDEPADMYLVFDRMRGGTLLNRIVEKEVYNEREARQVCRIAFTAIDYCHRKKVAHRDIKPENFLLVEAGDDTSVKIADFGFAKKVTHENSLKTICGTAHYVAPEILDNNVTGYDQRCDVWSLGVFAYVLLGGYPPFEGVLEDLADEVMKGEFEFHDEYWSDVSGTAKDMISSMLVVDPAKRLSVSEVLRCQWMGIEDENLIVKDLTKTQESIRRTLSNDHDVRSVASAPVQRNKFTSIAGMIDTSHNLAESMGVIPDDEEMFSDNYLMGDQIGIGTFSVVHEAIQKETKEIFAVKRVSRNDLHPSDAVALHDEIAALQQVSECQHIVRLFEVYDEPDHTFLVLECMKGGDLIDRIIEKRHYTEYDAKEVSRKLLMAVEYCHKLKIANRNLKPENLLLKAGSDTDVKISDFGYAKTVAFPNCLRTQCGTEGYVAPEILEHRPAYDIPCDMWSLGVIIYIVLGGYRPFRGEGEEVMRQIRYGEYKFHKRYWGHVSEDAKALIARMLTVDPEKRITATDALKSPWVTAGQKDLDGNELSDNMQNLEALKEDSKGKMNGDANTLVGVNKIQSLGGLRAYQDF